MVNLKSDFYLWRIVRAECNSRRIITFTLAFLLMFYLPLISWESQTRETADSVLTGVQAEILSSSRDVKAIICTWNNDRDAAVSLTYDDALSTQANLAAPLMHQRGLRGTFFIPVFDVGTCSANGFCGDWPQWIEIASWGNEIGSHTLTHPDLITLSQDQLWDEVVLAKRYLEENITGASIETFSFPYGSYNTEVMQLVREHYLASRCDRHNISAQPAPLSSSPPDPYKVIPCNFGNNENYTELNQLVEDAVNTNGWLVEMIHAIEGGGWDPVPINNLTAHLNYLSSREEDVWVAPFSNVTKYIRARDTATPEITPLSGDIFALLLNSSLNPEVYDEPLTVNITLPSDWEDLKVVIGENTFYVSSRQEDGEGYFLLDLPLNVSAEISKENYPPFLDFAELIPESGQCFEPLKGGSSTNFTFQVNYISRKNRNPDVSPVCIFDFNGDGDILDSIGNISEGPYPMDKMDSLDVNYADGCLYRLDFSFPPGSKPMFSFFARDNEGNDALSPTGMMEMIPGPIINDPPGEIDNFSLTLPYPLMPEFSFSRVTDPDLDLVYYRFDLFLVNEDNATALVSDFQFNEPIYRLKMNLSDHSYYTLRVWAEDSRGARGPVYNHSFYLNRPPLPVKSLFVKDLKGYENGLNISWLPLEEEDLEHYLLYRLNSSVNWLGENEPIALLNSEATSYLDMEVTDGKTYYYTIVGRDGDGSTDLYNFTLVTGHPLDDVPPLKIDGLEARDHPNSSGNLEISWNASQDARFQGYNIYRSIDSSDSTENVFPVHTTPLGLNNLTFWLDDEILDEMPYYYTVVAFDRAGNELRTDFDWVEGISIDDVIETKEHDNETRQIENDTGNGEGKGEKKETVDTMEIAIGAGIGSLVTIILVLILMLIILHRVNRYKEESEKTEEPEEEGPVKEKREDDKEEYEKLYGDVEKTQRRKRIPLKSTLKDLSRFRQKRKARRKKKSLSGDKLDISSDKKTNVDEKEKEESDVWDWADDGNKAETRDIEHTKEARPPYH